MQAVYGTHNWPGAPTGSFSVTPGPMALQMSLRQIVRGKGSHAAQPHKKAWTRSWCTQQSWQ
jgi:hippurate hydrolase